MKKKILSFLRLPFEILATLKKIEAHLAAIAETNRKFDQCLSERNHRGQMNVKTGHWND